MVRFCDFFKQYSINLRGLSKKMSIKDRPIAYNVVLLLLTLLAAALFVMASGFLPMNSIVLAVLFVFLIITFVLGFRNTEEYSQEMLDRHDKKYSGLRMDNIKTLLREYNAGINEESIDLLIKEAEIEKDERNPMTNKDLRYIGYAISMSISYFINVFVDKPKISLSIAFDFIVTMVIILLILYSLYLLLLPLLFPRLSDLGSLISDLRQYKIFYLHSKPERE